MKNYLLIVLLLALSRIVLSAKFFKRRRFLRSKKKVASNYTRFIGPTKITARFPENAEGDFYVINEVCISCGAPEAESQGLIEHSVKDQYGHCYFKKQPETEEEIEHAIRAIAVSCISALRYGGKDENILRKMYEFGLSGECDQQPAGSYRTVTRNLVTFYFGGNIDALFKMIVDEFVNKPGIKVIDFACDKTSRFSFIVRWTNMRPGNLIKCEYVNTSYYKISITSEVSSLQEVITGTAEELHDILKSKLPISNILWFENEISGIGVPRPTFV